MQLQFDLALDGCRPEPLISYLSALGLMRLISQQKDPGARYWWDDDRFHLCSALLFKESETDAQRQNAIVNFFLIEYQPTPIAVPWSGQSFLTEDADQREQEESKKGRKAIKAIRSSSHSRLEPYRRVLEACDQALAQLAIKKKKELESNKWGLIRHLRSTCEVPSFIEWIDAAAASGPDLFAPLLGSGGGSDGHTHFSDNFMLNLQDALPCLYDGALGSTTKKRKAQVALAEAQLRSALFASPPRLISNRTSALFDSGAVGGPNATQGFERNSLSNPWKVILALEGALGFAGSATKRLSTGALSRAAFPFQFSLTVTAADRLTRSDRAGKKRQGSEIWLPLWSSPARQSEVLALLHEGRAEIGTRHATTGLEMARAIAGLGTDRGVDAFQRFAIIPGRVGGANYSTAASLGKFQVRGHLEAALPEPIDRWLSGYRRLAEDQDAPPRFARAQLDLDQAIMDLCRDGGSAPRLALLIAIGNAEREAAITRGRLIHDRPPLAPAPQLPAHWLDQCDDGSAEFVIARSLAGIHDPEAKIGPIRANLEPITVAGRGTSWGEGRGSAVWSKSPLAANLTGILARRLMDGKRNGCAALPLASLAYTPLSAIGAFLAGDCDDKRLASLLWALALVKPGLPNPVALSPAPAPPPAAYALLKLLFLSMPPRIPELSLDTPIRSEPAILSLLRGGRVGEACGIAMRRLRASGLNPRPLPVPGRRVRDQDWLELGSGPGQLDPRRLAAALLIPISPASAGRLANIATRLPRESDRP